MIWKPWSHPTYGNRDFIRVSLNPNNAWISVFKSGDRWHINTSVWARDLISIATDNLLRQTSGDDSDALIKLVDQQLNKLGHTLVNDNKKLIML